MTLATFSSLLAAAEKGRYAVPALNAYNLESAQAAVFAAERARSPLILQYSHTTVTTHATPNALAGLSLGLIADSTVPIGLHYDHGKDINTLEGCLKAGFNSGMLDGSREPFEKNLQLSLKAVALARKHKAGIELEIGRLAGKEEWVAGQKGEYTDPKEAERFAKETKPDALAISIGSVHGQSEKHFNLDFSRLQDISSRVNLPLVLHGSSGVPDADLRRAVRLGIRKVNLNTQLRISFHRGVRNFMRANPQVHNPMEYLTAGREEMMATAMQRMRVLGSAGKA